MTLRLNVAKLSQAAATCDGCRIVGRLHKVGAVLTATFPAAVGELCSIPTGRDGGHVLAEVIGFDGARSHIMPYHPVRGLEADAPVFELGRPLKVPVGPQLLGRALDGLGQPIDGRGPLAARRRIPLEPPPPGPLERPRIRDPFLTGQRVIDGLLTLGRGQRVALMAGSGVGKSTLLGEIAKGAQSDVNVIALIGERGREVKPFFDDCLGPQGMSRTVAVVSTSDQTPLMRLRSAQTAVAIASYFRSQGANVLLLMDNITRLAMAQREIGLRLGEPPSARGYTPSVFQAIPDLLERLGNSDCGSITAILTVLVEGDELDEPLADTVRAVVDGHIVLDRRLAEKNHFPAINVLQSVSRVFLDVTSPADQIAAGKIRHVLSTYEDVKDLLRIGAYTAGTAPQIDRALELLPAVEDFLRQPIGKQAAWEETQNQLQRIAAAWPY